LRDLISIAIAAQHYRRQADADHEQCREPEQQRLYPTSHGRRRSGWFERCRQAITHARRLQHFFQCLLARQFVENLLVFQRDVK
jgi:hypothetical protein